MKGEDSTMTTHKSEVGHFRQQQALHEQAAQQGLSGLAVVATHASITARMEHGAKHILGLIHEGRHQETHTLLFAENWNHDDPEETVTDVGEETSVGTDVSRPVSTRHVRQDVIHRSLQAKFIHS